MGVLRRFARRQLHARPLACFAVAFLLGLMLRGRLDAPTPVCAAALAGAVGLGAILRRRRGALAALLLVAGLLAGMTRMGMALDARPPVTTRYSVTMEGRVVGEPFTNARTGRRIFPFELETADGAVCRMRLRMYLRGDAELLEAVDYGQRLRLVGHIWAADPVTNPYEFDFGAYLNRQDMDAYATAKAEDVTVVARVEDLHSAVIRVRRAIGRRIDRLFPRSAPMLRALVLGDRSMLRDEQREALNRSGTAHLISISGLHVTLLATLLALGLGRVLPRRMANAAAVALLLPYGALVGFNAPFMRALLTFALLSLASVAGMPSDAITRLCAAMLVWLLARPLSVSDAGFALSYSASAGILLLTPPLQRLCGLERLERIPPEVSWPRRVGRRAAGYVLSLVCVSLAAQLATLPAVVEFFGGQPLLSVLTNLVCVPLCMAGYLAGLAVLALSVVSMPLAAALAVAPDVMLVWLSDITRFAGSIPGVYVRIGRYPFALVLVHWGILLAASDLSLLPSRRRGPLSLGLAGVAGVAMLLVFVKAWPFSIVFLDAGQADCAVVRHHGHTYLIDAGDTYTPAADYLSATCLKLDGVILSHPHSDHAGGLSQVLESFRPGAVYVPRGWFEAGDVNDVVTQGIQQARDMGVEVRELSAGDALSLSDGATMTVYSPLAGHSYEDTNDLSLMTLIECQGQKALFTGDLSQAGEPPLIPDTDVLKVAHHGSDKATSQRFLEAATPQIAVISVGENNYGHPGEETLERLSAIGAQVLQTRRLGAITLTWRGDGWRISSFRQEDGHEVE